jgi:hypothetical protein
MQPNMSIASRNIQQSLASKVDISVMLPDHCMARGSSSIIDPGIECSFVTPEECPSDIWGFHDMVGSVL